jgi:hypothetical protein
VAFVSCPRKQQLSILGEYPDEKIDIGGQCIPARKNLHTHLKYIGGAVEMDKQSIAIFKAWSTAIIKMTRIHSALDNSFVCSSHPVYSQQEHSTQNSELICFSSGRLTTWRSSQQSGGKNETLKETLGAMTCLLWSGHFNQELQWKT